MPYRARPINWNFLLEPTMAGLQTEAAANRQLGANIVEAGRDVGQGLKNKRTEAESNRRFDAEQGLRERESDRQDAELGIKLKQAQEDQAYTSEAGDRFAKLSEVMNMEVSTLGQPRPETLDAAKQIDDMLKSKGVDPLGLLRSRAEKATESASSVRLRPGEPVYAVGGPGEPGVAKNKQYGDNSMWRERAAGEKDFGTGRTFQPPTAMRPMVPTAADGPVVNPTAGAGAPLVGERGVPIPDSEEMFSKAASLKQFMDVIEREMTSARRMVDSKSLHNNKARAEANRFLAEAEIRLVGLGAQYGSLMTRGRQSAKIESQAESDRRQQQQDAENIRSAESLFLANGGSKKDVEMARKAGITKPEHYWAFLKGRLDETAQTEKAGEEARKERVKWNIFAKANGMSEKDRAEGEVKMTQPGAFEIYSDAWTKRQGAQTSTQKGEASADVEIAKENRLRQNGLGSKERLSWEESKAAAAAKTLEEGARYGKVPERLIPTMPTDQLGALARSATVPPAVKALVTKELKTREDAMTPEEYAQALVPPDQWNAPTASGPAPAAPTAKIPAPSWVKPEDIPLWDAMTPEQQAARARRSR